MDHEVLAQRFWEQGYLVLEGFFDADLMDVYDQLILAHYGDDAQYVHSSEFLRKSATEVIPWFPQEEGVAAFDVVENDDRLVKLTGEILGPGWQSLYCMTMYSRQGSRGQAWHQDCAPQDPGKFNMNRLVYTSDITAQIGGQIVVVPGSHLRGELTVGDVDENFSDQLVLSPTKGTLIFLHGHTWHRVQPVTGKYRVSANFRSIPKGTPHDITDICLYRNMRYRFASSEVLEDRS